MSRVTRRCAGFTLVELLVAMVVFAIMSVMAYGGLKAALNTAERTEFHAERLEKIQLVYRTLERDLGQIVDRGVRNEFGDPIAAVIGNGSRENLLEFTRGGWRNPTGQLRSSLERISYGVEDGKLVRRRWPTLDRSQNDKVVEWDLVSDIEAVTVRFLDDKQVWLNTWLFDKIEDATLPLAIEFTLDSKDWGKLVWLFRVQ